ncbi:ATPase family AAA domain-containing protein, partial [Trifolium medium]|nr:ATPase family AAA domain-containing protein [Trifolium medium]
MSVASFFANLRSYYVGCEDKAEGSLWTYKYKPTKAVE